MRSAVSQWPERWGDGAVVTEEDKRQVNEHDREPAAQELLDAEHWEATCG